MIALIGTRGASETGLMYEAALVRRAVEHTWIDIATLAGNVVTEGIGLRELVERGSGLMVDPDAEFRFENTSGLQSVRAALNVDVRTEYEPASPAIAKALQHIGIAQVNPPGAVLAAKDKWLTHTMLADSEVLRPFTCLVTNVEAALEFAAGSSYPIVLKPRARAKGVGVCLARDEPEMRSKASELLAYDGSILVEQYVECGSRDKRVLVVDGRIAGAMLRVAPDGDFRSNLALGGTAEVTDLSDVEADVALKATKLLGLRFGGIDIARVATADLVNMPVGEVFCIEANSGAGISGFATVTGIDVSDRVIEMLLDDLGGNA